MSGMRNSSRQAKIGLALLLFVLLYGPAYWVWTAARPAYCQILANTAQRAANTFEFSDTAYRISIAGENFKGTANVVVRPPRGRESQFELGGERPTGEVTYNLGLWLALYAATLLFISPRARLWFGLGAPLGIMLWHLCDLFIFLKNTRWVLIKDLAREFPGIVIYSSSWNWFWWWWMELNDRIIDPLLPLALWIIICAPSFLRRPPQALENSALAAPAKFKLKETSAHRSS